MIRFQPSHLSRRNGRQGDIDAVNKNWSNYIECAQKEIGKGKNFYHPMGKAFHSLATSDKSAFRSCQDMWTYFRNEVLRYNKENPPVRDTDFKLNTTSVTEVKTYAEGEVGGESGVDDTGVDAPAVEGEETSGGTAESGGIGVGGMVLIGVGALALLGGAYWYVNRD